MLYRLASARTAVSHQALKRMAVQVRFHNGHKKPHQPIEPTPPTTWRDYWRMVIGTYWDDKDPRREAQKVHSYQGGDRSKYFNRDTAENIIGMVAVSSVFGLVCPSVLRDDVDLRVF